MTACCTILIDAREKRPLVFPAHLVLMDPTFPPAHRRLRTVRLSTRRETLPTADYLLASDPGVVYTCGSGPVIVETKRSLSEIAANVLDPHKRPLFLAQLRRMQSHGRAFLVVEGGLSTLYASSVQGMVAGNGSPSFPPDPCAIDALLGCCLDHGVHPYLLEGSGVVARRRAADFVARLLLVGATSGNALLRPAEQVAPPV